MQKIQKKVLKNGLTIIFSNDSRYTTSTVLFGFNVGWKHDKKGYEGLAHLFEHLIGKRTKQFPSKGSLDKEKETLGIKFNAVTYSDFTYYYQNQLNHNLLKSVELIFEAIYNSNFDNGDLKLERNVVLTEASEYKEDDYKYLSYLSRKQVFGNSPSANFFFGNKVSLNKIKIETFQEFYNIYKNPKNSTLVISSNSEIYNEKIVKFVEFFYRNNVTTTNDLNIGGSKIFSQNTAKVQKYKAKGDMQAGILFSYVTEQLTLKEKVQYKFLENLLANSHSAKILNKLRDGLGLIYWLDMYSLNWKDVSEILLYTKTDKKNVKEVISVVEDTIEQIKLSLNQTDLSTVVEKIKFDVVGGVTSMGDSEYIFETVSIFNEYISTEEFVQIIEDTKFQDVKELAAKVFNLKNRHVSILSS